MPEVRPFRGIRFNPLHQPDLGRVIAPPYDSFDPALALRPTSIAALENVDLGNGPDAHATAAARYQAWRANGTLVVDDRPAFYVHNHAFVIDGEWRQRRGLLARVRLAPWADGSVLPHERVFPGPRDERLARLAAVKANLSPLYLLYRDAGEVRQALTAALVNTAPVATGIDAHRGEHELFALTDTVRQAHIQELLAARSLFVADGHHRYEAALAYRNRLARHGELSADDPARYVLALLAPMDDPGVIVRPTHRVVTGRPGLTGKALATVLLPLFDLVVGELPPTETRSPICRLAIRGERQLWSVLPRDGRPEQALMPPDRGATWRCLDVAIGDHVLLDVLLGIGPAAGTGGVWFTPKESVARAAVTAGDAPLAMLYAPPSLPQLIAVAEAGELLPPKSTYFDPKPPAGLVISDHAIE